MAETNFPNGVSVPSGHVGNVAPIVTTTGLRFAAGSAVLSNAGTVDVNTGLTSVLYVQATPSGLLASTAGTAGGFAIATAQIKSGATVMIKGYDALGTASSVIGTAFWFAVGT